MRNTVLKSLTIGMIVYASVNTVLNAAWLKAFGPANGVSGLFMQSSPQRNYYLHGAKSSGPFVAKLDNLGHLKWSKQLISPINIDSASLTLSPPFTYMFHTHPLTSSAASPFVWGKISQNDNTGAVTKAYAKTFVKQLPGYQTLQAYKDKGNRLYSYALVGTVNSNVRGGSNIPENDSVIGNINSVNGKFTWSHIYGFNLNGLTPSGIGQSLWFSKRASNYYFSRPLFLKNPAKANAPTEFSTIVVKLSSNGAILKQIMIDGLAGLTHSILQDGSVMVYARSIDFAFTLIKLDSNLNLLWQKKYVSSIPSYPITLDSLPSINELQDGTLELKGVHIASTASFANPPIFVHINKQTGNLVSKKEIRFGLNNGFLNGGAFPTNTGLPSAFSWFAGSTRSSPTTNGDIFYGKLNKNLSFSWLKALPGLDPASNSIPYFVHPNDNLATNYSLSGITTKSSSTTAPLMLAGLLNASGNVPGCPTVSSVTTVTTVIPPIIAQSSNKSIHLTKTVKDFGPLPALVNKTTPTIKVTNLPLQETNICQ